MDKYEKVSALGAGTHGQVFLLRRRADGQQVCAKLVPASDSQKVEVQLLEQLQHPNIVRFQESFTDDNGDCWIVMEYCNHGDLRQQIVRNKRNPLSEHQILAHFTQIVLGLHHMHSNKILHRDLKSNNIFLAACAGLAEDDNTINNRLVLGDFGISKNLNTTMADTCIGTPLYMSPEMFDGEPYDYKADIWALGCVLYELLTGKYPFKAKSSSALILKISSGAYKPISSALYSKQMEDLLASLLSLKQTDRPSTSDLLQLSFLQPYISSFVLQLRLVNQSSAEVLGERQVQNLNKQLDALKRQQIQNENKIQKIPEARADFCITGTSFGISKRIEKKPATPSSLNQMRAVETTTAGRSNRTCSNKKSLKYQSPFAQKQQQILPPPPPPPPPPVLGEKELIVLVNDQNEWNSSTAIVEGKDIRSPQYKKQIQQQLRLLEKQESRLLQELDRVRNAKRHLKTLL